MAEAISENKKDVGTELETGDVTEARPENLLETIESQFDSIYILSGSERFFGRREDVEALDYPHEADLDASPDSVLIVYPEYLESLGGDLTLYGRMLEDDFEGIVVPSHYNGREIVPPERMDIEDGFYPSELSYRDRALLYSQND
ncbi:MAG: hypothetical protein ABEJ56_06295 [Candidatus Nanohaloarchaea archaeon]